MFAAHSRRWATRSLPLVCVMVGPAAAQQTIPTGVEATTTTASAPDGIAYDSVGNLYIALRNDHVVRKVDVFGIITTVAGTGQQGFSGDGGTATGALLDSPSGIAIGTNGDIFIADSRNHRIRRVSAGVINTVAGNGSAGFSGDGDSPAAAQLNLPTGVSLDSSGNLYIADTNNQRVRKIAGGIITTVAGTGEQGFAGDGQPALAALLDSPYSVAADPVSLGSFYIADTHNQRVRRVNSSGVISTVAGTGAGASQAALSLLNPRGLSVDALGNIYFADSGNEVVQSLSSAGLNTIAGTGAQGFAGDIGNATLALLDTPQATATGPNGLLALADTRNGRVRSIVSGAINTVAGISPPLTAGILLSGPTVGTFGAGNERLTAAFSSLVSSATGSLTLNVNGQASATVPLAGNAASFNLGGLAGGLQTLTVSFAGDTNNAPAVSGVFLVNVASAAQSISFAAPQSPVTYMPGATVQLTASASSGLPVTYQVTGPATVTGSTLTYTGSGSVVVTALQAGNANYSAATAVRTVAVSPSPLVASTVNPATVMLSAATTPVSVSGSGFTATSVIRVGGVALTSAVRGPNTITTMLPPVLVTTPLSVTVYDSASQFESNALLLPVSAPAATATLTAPSTGSSAQQPSLNLALQNAYPVPIQGVLTLTFAPTGIAGSDDSSIQFPNGSRTYSFTIPANTTAIPPIQFQTGTLAGVATFTLSLNAAGVDVTPAASRVVAVTIPAEVPTANSVSFTQSGPTVTVTLVGFSNTKSVSQATFNFTPAPGTSLGVTSLSLPVTTIFNDWFSSAASSTLGSVFTYTQTFNLSDADAKVQTVTVTLTNPVGNSVPRATP